MLAPMHLIPISDFADVEPVLEEMGKRPHAKANSAALAAIATALDLGPDAPPVELGNQSAHGAECEIEAEDGADRLCLLGSDEPRCFGPRPSWRCCRPIERQGTNEPAHGDTGGDIKPVLPTWQRITAAVPGLELRSCRNGPRNGPATSLDLQEQSHERALAMRICLVKDRFQLIAGRLP